jgi:hypothetical protein
MSEKDPTEFHTADLTDLAADFRDYFDEVDAAVAAITSTEIEARLAQLLRGNAVQPAELARELLSDAAEGVPADEEEPAAVPADPAACNPEAATTRGGGRHAAPAAEGDSPTPGKEDRETVHPTAARSNPSRAHMMADLAMAESHAAAAEARAREAERRLKDAETEAATASWEATVARVQAEKTSQRAQAYLDEARTYRHAAVERAGAIVAKAREEAKALTDRAHAEVEAAMARANQIVNDANDLADRIRAEVGEELVSALQTPSPGPRMTISTSPIASQSQAAPGEPGAEPLSQVPTMLDCAGPALFLSENLWLTFKVPSDVRLPKRLNGPSAGARIWLAEAQDQHLMSRRIAPACPETHWRESLADGLRLVLSVVGGLQFRGWDVAAVLVEAAVDEPVDPFGSGDLDVVDGLSGAAWFDQFGLVQGVVVGIAHRPDGRADAGLGEAFPVPQRGVLRSAIALCHNGLQARTGPPAAPDRLREGVQDELDRHRRATPPAQDPPGDQVRGPLGLRIGDRGLLDLSPAGTDQASGAHQSFHRAAGHRDALAVEGRPHLAGPIDGEVLPVDPTDVLQHVHIPQCAGGRGPGLVFVVFVVRGWGDLAAVLGQQGEATGVLLPAL